MNTEGSPKLLTGAGLGRRLPTGTWLFRGLDVELRGGDRLVLVGPSGSGKSVLLRTLALLEAADEGVVSWDGAVPRGNAVPTFRARVVYLQQRATMVEGRVEDNLRLPFGLRAHGARRWSGERAVALLGDLGRDPDFLARPAAELSGGEGQIVAFTRALQLDPQLLLLDEPTAALDVPTARALEGAVVRWVGERFAERAFLWASHDPELAGRLSASELRPFDPPAPGARR